MGAAAYFIIRNKIRARKYQKELGTDYAVLRKKSCLTRLKEEISSITDMEILKRAIVKNNQRLLPSGKRCDCGNCRNAEGLCRYQTSVKLQSNDYIRGCELEQFNLEQLLHRKKTLETAKNKAVLRSTEPMLVQHTIFVQSDEYPAIDILLQKMQYIWTGFAEVHDDDVDYNLLANIYLQKHSLRDAIADPDIDLQTLHTLIRLKSDELKQLIRLWIPYGDYLKFIEDFFQEHAFETVPFSVFCNGLRETGCTDIDSLFAQWYNGYGTPAIIIRETMPRLIMGQETEMYSMGFKAYNISDKNRFADNCGNKFSDVHNHSASRKLQSHSENSISVRAKSLNHHQEIG